MHLSKHISIQQVGGYPYEMYNMKKSQRRLTTRTVIFQETPRSFTGAFAGVVMLCWVRKAESSRNLKTGAVHAQALGMELPDKIASEAAWAEANSARGPHSLIRQPAMRMFWWRCFGSSEEVAWDVFWTRFPKDLERHISISPPLESVHDSIAHVRRNALAAFTSHGLVQHSITLKRSRYDCGTMPACHFCGYLP